MKHRDFVYYGGYFWVCIVISAIIAASAGCKTISPTAPKVTQPAIDNGFIRWTNWPVAHSGVFTAAATARFVALEVKWGADARFVPAIKPWDGVAQELDGVGQTNYILTAGGIVQFLELADLQRQRAVP